MLINGGNYFHEKAFNEICDALEKANTVQLYIDCVGHSRNNNEQEAYKEALTKKFGDRLHIECSKGAYNYSYSYRLKYFVCK